MRVLIIRHADPEYFGDTLTELGRKEASALAERLERGIEGRPSRLYTSPLGRARATAAATEQRLGLVAEVEDWTRELSHWPRLGEAGGGDARPGEGGMALWDLPPGDVRGRAAEPPMSHATQWARVPQLEAIRSQFDEICAESDKFLARHGFVREDGQYRILTPNREIIAVFCHGGFGLTWLAHLLDMPLPMVWSSFWLPPSSVTTVLFEERGVDFATPRVIGMGDIGHLYQANLSIPMSRYEKPNVYGAQRRPSGIKANFW